MAGIYIHIPFCRQACHYCNFHFSTSLHSKKEMILSIVKEIGITPLPVPAQHTAEACIDTLYFGGGTPSLLNIDELKMLIEAVKEKFIFTANPEITLEANPDDIDSLVLEQWQKAGINRLSVGIQSFAEEDLKWMNRVHSAAEAYQCLDLVGASGISNFSIDLIYGSPLLTDDTWKRNVEYLIEKNIPHISCYALTVEPRTALHKMIGLKKKEPVDPEKQARHFLLLMDWMQQGGYEHYEISNFAKSGMRSRHNSSYWSGKHYYGFGPSAHSFDGTCRRWNIASNALYIKSLEKNLVPFEEETLTATQQLNEYIMTALRTKEGLSLETVSSKFGIQQAKQILKACEKWEQGGKLFSGNGSIILTKEGKLFADGIAVDLFF